MGAQKSTIDFDGVKAAVEAGKPIIIGNYNLIFIIYHSWARLGQLGTKPLIDVSYFFSVKVLVTIKLLSIWMMNEL